MPSVRSFLATFMAATGLAAAGMPQAGQPAPPFAAQDQSGKTVQLADYRGKATVVLYFYPKDDTPGCTKEACSLRDGYHAIQATGAVVLGVSADTVDSHAAFAGKFSLPFPLLADPDRTIIDAYGVRMAVVGIARRVTFIIGKDGLVKHVVQDVKPAEHDQQVLELLKATS